jgi:hypothetical protein
MPFVALNDVICKINCVLSLIEILAQAPIALNFAIIEAKILDSAKQDKEGFVRLVSVKLFHQESYC